MMNLNIRPATDSRPDIFRAGARQIAALGADSVPLYARGRGPVRCPDPEPLGRRPLKTLREERWA